MQAIATGTAQRAAAENARARAMIRFNGLMFHGLAVAWFLEAVAPRQAARRARVFEAHPEVGAWLAQVWCPQRAGHAERLREYSEATWPEFDWNGAWEAFQASYRPRSALQGARAGPALEALAGCATAAQAAVFYRALARGADEPQLRALAGEAARDHADYFDYFRSVFELVQRRERVGFTAAVRTVRSSCRSARELDVAAAFEPLAHHWRAERTVPEMSYGEFLARMAQLIARYAAPGRLERLLFAPWLEPARAAAAPQRAPKPAWRWLGSALGRAA
jgi:hypothetical protein